jgi:hypothetical protein
MSDAPESRPPLGLMIAGGLVVGLVASALLPRGTGRKLAKGAMAAAAVGSEASKSFARQARDKAGNAGSSGLDLARTAINLLGSLRR